MPSQRTNATAPPRRRTPPRSEGLDLSGAEARRIALAAQGFAQRAPAARPGIAQLRTLAARLHAFQIDSVNVLVRAHYVPAFSRLGPYPMDALDRLAYERRELFEYIGHAASLIPVTLHPLLRWRMEVHERWAWGSKDPRYIDAIMAEVRDRGALSAAELSDPGERNGPWWGWAKGKRALEWLHWSGGLAIAGRRGFERVYDLPERVIPRAVLDAPTPPVDEARKELLVLAARALGVGTAKDVITYFYLQRAGEARTLRRLVDDLVAEGRLVEVTVEGWRHPAYMLPRTRVPRPVEARALISPFDPLVWERERTRRLFGFDYRIEIYVPAPKRVHGYYVLPFLLGESLVARVDLKADRKARRLVVQGAFVEPGEDARAVAGELAAELRRMAAWLELEKIRVGRRGDLARALARAV